MSLVVGLPLVPTIPCCNSRRFVDLINQSETNLCVCVCMCVLTPPLPARSRPPQDVWSPGVILQTSGFGRGGYGMFRPQQMVARRNRKRQCKQPKTRRGEAELSVRFCTPVSQNGLNALCRQRVNVISVQPIRSCRAAVSGSAPN